jgi:hypothetical protein
MHFLHCEHFSGSMRTSKMLILLKKDCIAPKGQNKPHWMRRLDSMGSTTTKAMNSKTKIAICTMAKGVVGAWNSVTSLNGHSHSQ